MTRSHNSARRGRRRFFCRLYHVLQTLERQYLDHVTGCLGLEHCFFFGERVDSLASFRRCFALHDKLRETGENEDATLKVIQYLFVTNET